MGKGLPNRRFASQAFLRFVASLEGSRCAQEYRQPIRKPTLTIPKINICLLLDWPMIDRLPRTYLLRKAPCEMAKL